MQLLEVFEKGNFSKVIENWDKLQFQASQDPDSAFIVVYHFRLGDMQKACEICELIRRIVIQQCKFLSMYAAVLRRLNLLTISRRCIQTSFVDRTRIKKEIKNNYSNLLIDQKKYDQAIKILNDILASFPNTKMQFLTSERCKSLINDLNIKRSANAQDNSIAKVFGDPLQEAFNPSEVSRVGGKIGNITASVHEL